MTLAGIPSVVDACPVRLSPMNFDWNNQFSSAHRMILANNAREVQTVVVLNQRTVNKPTAEDLAPLLHERTVEQQLDRLFHEKFELYKKMQIHHDYVEKRKMKALAQGKSSIS